MGRWLTPDTNAAPVYLSRVLFFRAELAGVITGLLQTMTQEWLWEQHGDMTEAQAASHAADMLEAYLNGGDMSRVGTIVHYLNQTSPVGILPCDGSTYNRVDYPNLYAALDPIFHASADTFTLPDLRGRVLVTSGLGTSLTNRNLGDSVGLETVTLELANIPAHTHSEIAAVDSVINGGLEAPAPAAVSSPTVTGSSGGGAAHENMQPSLVVHTGVYYQ